MNRALPTVAVVVMLATAGCVGSIPGFGGDGGGGAAQPVEHVPAGVDAVVTVDADVLQDENTRAVLNTLFEESEAGPDDPQSVNEALEQVQEQLNDNLSANLSIEAVNGMAAFARTPAPSETSDVEANQYAGVVVSVEWDREDVLTNLRDENTVTESTYQEVTVYEIVNETSEEPLYAAEYRDGLWAFSGNRTVVTDVVDVAQGDADTFSGDLRTAFDRTRDDAYVRYATTLTDQQRESVGSLAALYGASAPVDLTQFAAVTAYAGDYYTEGDNVGVSTYLTATNESAAERINQTVGALIQLGKGTVEPGTPAEAQIDALSSSHEETTVSITYEIPVSELQDLIREESSSNALAPAPIAPDTTGVGTAG